MNVDRQSGQTLRGRSDVALFFWHSAPDAEALTVSTRRNNPRAAAGLPKLVARVGCSPSDLNAPRAVLHFYKGEVR